MPLSASGDICSHYLYIIHKSWRFSARLLAGPVTALLLLLLYTLHIAVTGCKAHYKIMASKTVTKQWQTIGLENPACGSLQCIAYNRNNLLYVTHYVLHYTYVAIKTLKVKNTNTCNMQQKTSMHAVSYPWHGCLCRARAIIWYTLFTSFVKIISATGF